MSISAVSTSTSTGSSLHEIDGLLVESGKFKSVTKGMADCVAKKDQRGFIDLYIRSQLNLSDQDLKQLKADSEKYGQLQAGAESLSAGLQSVMGNTKGGVVDLLAEEPPSNMRLYINKALEEDARLRKTDPARPPPPEALSKLMSGKSLSQKEATSLQAFFADLKIKVIPSDKTSEVLSAKLSRLIAEASKLYQDIESFIETATGAKFIR